MDQMTKHPDLFRKYAMEDDTELGFYMFMPCNLSTSLDAFEKLLLVKLLRPDKIIFGIQKYLEIELGHLYSISPVSSMENLFHAASKSAPIIFVLS